MTHSRPSTSTHISELRAVPTGRLILIPLDAARQVGCYAADLLTAANSVADACVELGWHTSGLSTPSVLPIAESEPGYALLRLAYLGTDTGTPAGTLEGTDADRQIMLLEASGIYLYGTGDLPLPVRLLGGCWAAQLAPPALFAAFAQDQDTRALNAAICAHLSALTGEAVTDVHRWASKLRARRLEMLADGEVRFSALESESLMVKLCTAVYGDTFELSHGVTAHVLSQRQVLLMRAGRAFTVSAVPAIGGAAFAEMPAGQYARSVTVSRSELSFQEDFQEPVLQIDHPSHPEAIPLGSLRFQRRPAVVWDEYGVLAYRLTDDAAVWLQGELVRFCRQQQQRALIS